MKSGFVAILGRPNTGKSTLLNAILGHKVSITSPKPQTTRFTIEAVYEDTRGQIVFLDTPGILWKVEDPVAKRINLRAQDTANRNIDVLLHLIDHTRERSLEENKALGFVRKFSCPKILVVNKTDIKSPTHIVQYKFMQEEYDEVIYLSALKGTNVKSLMELIFSFLPERQAIVDSRLPGHTGLNMDSKKFLEEIIREKAFLFLRREVPYTITTAVDEVSNRDNGTLFVRARIITNEDRYKSMIIGEKGKMIKEISMAARKELEVAANRKVFIELTVEVNPHWIDTL